VRCYVGTCARVRGRRYVRLLIQCYVRAALRVSYRVIVRAVVRVHRDVDVRVHGRVCAVADPSLIGWYGRVGGRNNPVVVTSLIRLFSR
jgi:hypothetical protein